MGPILVTKILRSGPSWKLRKQKQKQKQKKKTVKSVLLKKKTPEMGLNLRKSRKRSKTILRDFRTWFYAIKRLFEVKAPFVLHT